MQSPRAEIARERRRQLQVRKAFSAGLEAAAPWGARDPGPFYLACSDYLAFSMDRLHEQDQVIHDLLRERIDPAEHDVLARLAVLDGRQANSRQLLDSLRATAARLRTAGGEGRAEFEERARGISAAFDALLEPRRNPFFRHTDSLFADGDWVRIADVTPASILREHALFDRVRATAPPGADPEGFTAVHLPPGGARPANDASTEKGTS